MKRTLIILLAVAAVLSSCGDGACCKKGQKDSGKNATLETIMNRKSVRSYTDEKLTSEQIETLLRAAMAAPSGINLQPWRFIVVTDQAVKDALQGEKRGPRPRTMYSDCAAIFVVCGETMWTNREGTLVPNRNWTADCAAATENLLLAAESLGLGAVWTACYPYEERISQVTEVLGIPEGVTPFCLVPVGHPAGDEQPKDKWKPENIHYDRW